jgi:transglutaminase-like putative cysteine protease
MEVAPLERSHDDTAWNDFFNAAVANHRDPDDEDAVFTLLQLAPKFDFSNTLFVRRERPDWGAPEYTFTPAPVEEAPATDMLKVTFEDLLEPVGVPRVTIEAVVPTKSFTNYMPEKVNKFHCVRTTTPWPMARREVAAAVTECISPDWSPRLNVESILCWVYHNIEYKGDEVGSRYGVAQVLRQRYGHCWDKTDVFITMCRLAEFPARQVFGWLKGQGGHVWAQVDFDDEGWVSVDPTCSWLGVTDDYIPLFITEDGHPPFVYTAMPEVEPITER